MHSVVACLAATAVGSTLPVYAILFGDVIGVSTLGNISMYEASLYTFIM